MKLPLRQVVLHYSITHPNILIRAVSATYDIRTDLIETNLLYAF